MYSVGAAPGLAAPDSGLPLLRSVYRLLHRVRVGRILRALRGDHPPAALRALHLPHGLQPQAHGLDGHLEVLVSVLGVQPQTHGLDGHLEVLVSVLGVQTHGLDGHLEVLVSSPDPNSKHPLQCIWIQPQTHGLQPQAHGLDGHLEVLVSSH